MWGEKVETESASETGLKGHVFKLPVSIWSGGVVSSNHSRIAGNG